MSTHNISEDTLFVILPARPRFSDELKALYEKICSKRDYDVIIDFSTVEVVFSSDISKLIELHKILDEHGRCLILCNVGFLNKCVFKIAGLNSFFNFAKDKDDALAAIQQRKQPEHSTAQG